MPVHTADLDRAAAPARLSRTPEPAGPHWIARSVVMSVGAMLVGLGLTLAGGWWLIPIGVAATIVAIHHAGIRQSAALGAWGGLLFAGVHLGWLSSVGVDAAVAVVALFAVWWAVVMLAVRFVLTLPLWPLIVPTVWVLQEWLISRWPLGGFPWARLGYATVDGPFAPWIPMVGAYGMTYLVSAVGAGLAALLVWRGRRRMVAALAAVGVLAVTVGSGMVLPWKAPTAGAAVNVAVVQGGPQPGIGWEQAQSVLMAHVNQTRSLATRASTPLDLVLWPESSTDIDPLVDPWARSQIDSAAKAINAPVVVGAVTAAPGDRDRVRNQAIVWSPTTGAGASYTKQRLVPFGEYVPARGLLERLTSRLAQVPKDFVAGEGPPVLQVGQFTLGVLICYEVAFDDRVRDAIDAGATVLSVPSNNATYQGTDQPGQQLGIARFRALETSRAVIVASTTGLSAIIEPDGTVVGSLEDGASGTLTGSVTQSSYVTSAVRWGGVIGGSLALVGLLSIAIGVRRHRTSRTRMS